MVATALIRLRGTEVLVRIDSGYEPIDFDAIKTALQRNPQTDTIEAVATALAELGYDFDFIEPVVIEV